MSARVTPPTYALILFLLIHTIMSIDRSIISVVIEPIKREYALSDFTLGLLTLGFALFFAFAGLPLGRWVDRGARSVVLAVCVGMFSLMTAAASFTHNLGQLLITRFAVGAGEAGSAPAMLSMLADFYPLQRRASVTSIYYLGVPLGFVVTFSIGGWVAQVYGWRSVFLVASAPGIVLTIGVLLALKEPRRGAFAAATSAEPVASWSESLKFIVSQPAQRHVLAAMAIISLLSAAVVSWSSSFLIRTHGVPLATAGLSLAVAYGVVGALGSLGGGWLTDCLSRRDLRWRAWTAAAAAAAALPAMANFLLAPTLRSAVFGLCMWSLLTTSIYGPAIALSQSLAPPRMRGTAAALFYLVSNLVGVGLGPLLVGAVSDHVRPSVGAGSLRYALLYAAVLYLGAAAHFFVAGRSLRDDLSRVARLTPLTMPMAQAAIGDS